MKPLKLIGAVVAAAMLTGVTNIMALTFLYLLYQMLHK